ncbi:hypothetical protein GFB56_37270 [Ensifer sp. T173]|uniref:Uncharacterized protein n=1 Tax=Ensifer canadensis TaxID=555315 RepID=A0AAW4FY43_9HYPH|nr:CbiQ family ECF transporter T component [Ensifer canadensis]MBM3096296.1 hypothetical protein [Ensifer canadensis]UBI79426.1 hypothetical protein J3R84_28585 [Ensifer canadensis]
MRAIDRCAQTNRWRHYAAGEKLLFAVGVMAVSLISAGWAGQVVILIAMLVLMNIGAGIAWVDILRAARVPFLFIATGTLAQLVSVTVVGYVPTFSLVSVEGIDKACFVALRSGTCVSALLFLALTTPLSSILQLLQRMGLNAEISDITVFCSHLFYLACSTVPGGWKPDLQQEATPVV